MVWTRIGGIVYIGRRMLRMELPGKPIGRPRCMVVVKDMKLTGVRKEEVEDRVRWRKMLCWDEP